MDYNGFYDDDGNKLNPDLFPKPQLCLSCENNNIEDEDEEILCILNRLDQQKESNFNCHAYKSMTIIFDENQ